jgi:hypothetical protein
VKRTFFVKRLEPVEIEFDFPIYRKHDLEMDYPNSVIYSRIDEAGSVSITKREGRNVDFQIEIGAHTLADEADYALGRGKFASSREEFAEIAREVAASLAKRGGFRFSFE